MTEFCEQSDLPKDQCAHCLGHTDRDGPWETFNSIRARFSSTLACGHYVVVGDTIHQTADDEWVCGTCSKSV